jgi:hypothetical protein
MAAHDCSMQSGLMSAFSSTAPSQSSSMLLHCSVCGFTSDAHALGHVPPDEQVCEPARHGPTLTVPDAPV